MSCAEAATLWLWRVARMAAFPACELELDWDAAVELGGPVHQWPPVAGPSIESASKANTRRTAAWPRDWKTFLCRCRALWSW